MFEDSSDKEDARSYPNRREFLKIAAGMAVALSFARPREAAAIIENFVKENSEGEEGPKFFVEFFLSWHITAQDKRGLEKKIKTADVFSPEAFGWNQRYLNAFQDISKGKLNPEEIARSFEIEPGTPIAATLKVLYKTGTHIEIFDLEKDNPLTLEVEMADRDLREFDDTKSFDEIVRDFTEKIRKYAETQVQRESYILQKILFFRDKVVKGEVPELKNKRAIKLLLAYGAFHTSLAHGMPGHSNWTFERLPAVFDHTSEAIRRSMLDKELNEDLSARAFFSLHTSGLFSSFLPGFDTQKKSAFIRKIIENMTIEEIRGTFEKIKQIGFNQLGSREVIRKIIEKTGIDLPLTIDVFEKIIFKIEKTGKI